LLSFLTHYFLNYLLVRVIGFITHPAWSLKGFICLLFNVLISLLLFLQKLFNYTPLFRFCQELFLFFYFLFLSCEVLIYITTFVAFCQALFLFFYVLFLSIRKTSNVFNVIILCHITSLYIYIHFLIFVCSQQLIYNTTFFCFCQ
jgi:hypothetical protein